MSIWHSVRIRTELLDRLKVAAKSEGRSVASMADLLLTNAMDDDLFRGARTGNADRRYPNRALDREPNTSASSGGGSTSSESIPGESGRGAEVGRQGTDEADGSPLPVADPASASDRASYGAQITVDEALGRCPVCNDSLDDERRCVDPECSSHRAAS